MRAAALESGRGAPIRHVTGALVAKEKTSGNSAWKQPRSRSPAPSRIDMLHSAERKKNNGVVGPFLPPVSLQPFAAPS